jgi:very-short-patch-repair endonuclease
MPNMSTLRRAMFEDMTIRNLSLATQQSYVHNIAGDGAAGVRTTKAEELLWAQLRGRQGAKFRRQVSFDRISLTSPVTQRSSSSSWTASSKIAAPLRAPARTPVFPAYDVRVVRLTNTDVLNDLDCVLARIHAELRLPFD